MVVFFLVSFDLFGSRHKCSVDEQAEHHMKDDNSQDCSPDVARLTVSSNNTCQGHKI